MIRHSDQVNTDWKSVSVICPMKTLGEETRSRELHKTHIILGKVLCPFIWKLLVSRNSHGKRREPP